MSWSKRIWLPSPKLSLLKEAIHHFNACKVVWKKCTWFNCTEACKYFRSKLDVWPKEILQERWQELLKHLIALGIVATNRCDEAMAELKAFKNNDVKKMHTEFSGFTLEECRLFRVECFYFYRPFLTISCCKV